MENDRDIEVSDFGFRSTFNTGKSNELFKRILASTAAAAATSRRKVSYDSEQLNKTK